MNETKEEIYKKALEVIAYSGLEATTALLIPWNAHLGFYNDGSNLAPRLAQAALDRAEYGPAPACYNPLYRRTEQGIRWPPLKRRKKP